MENEGGKTKPNLESGYFNESNPNLHIKMHLDKYIEEKNDPEYAILVTGPWGSGKTFFIKEYIKHYTNRDNKVFESKIIYLSLIGISNLDEVKNAILAEYNSKGLLKKVQNTKFSLNFSFLNISLSVKDVVDLVISEIHKKTNVTYIFDDLERCKIELEKILGYITGVLSNKGSRVILLANEEKIDLKALELNENNSIYRNIKEKLVGTTYNLQPDFTNVLNTIFDQCFDDDKAVCLIKEIRESYKVVFIDFMTSLDNQNFRIIKASFNNLKVFISFYEEFISKNLTMEDVLKLYKVYLFCQIYIQKGLIKDLQLEELLRFPRPDKDIDRELASIRSEIKRAAEVDSYFLNSSAFLLGNISYRIYSISMLQASWNSHQIGNLKWDYLFGDFKLWDKSTVINSIIEIYKAIVANRFEEINLLMQNIFLYFYIRCVYLEENDCERELIEIMYNVLENKELLSFDRILSNDTSLIDRNFSYSSNEDDRFFSNIYFQKIDFYIKLRIKHNNFDFNNLRVVLCHNTFNTVYVHLIYGSLDLENENQKFIFYDTLSNYFFTEDLPHKLLLFYILTPPIFRYNYKDILFNLFYTSKIESSLLFSKYFKPLFDLFYEYFNSSEKALKIYTHISQRYSKSFYIDKGFDQNEHKLFYTMELLPMLQNLKNKFQFQE